METASRVRYQSHEKQSLQYHASVLPAEQSKDAAVRSLVFHHPDDRVERARPYHAWLRAILGNSSRGGCNGYWNFHVVWSRRCTNQESRASFHKQSGQFSEFPSRVPDSRVCHRHVALCEPTPLARHFRSCARHWVKTHFPRAGWQRSHAAHFQSVQPRRRDYTAAVPRRRIRSALSLHREY